MSIRRAAREHPAAAHTAADRVGHFVLPPMQNLQVVPQPTAAFGNTSQFFLDVKVATLESNRIDADIERVLRMLPDTPAKPTARDFVMVLTISGIGHPDDRLRIAASVGQLWEEGMKKLAPDTERSQLISAMNMTQTESSCSPTSSTSKLYWFTSTENQQKWVRSKIFARAADGGGASQTGIPGFANLAFGPMPGPTMIDAESQEQQPYDRSEVSASGQAASAQDTTNSQTRTYVFKASSAAARRAGPAAKRRRAFGP